MPVRRERGWGGTASPRWPSMRSCRRMAPSEELGSGGTVQQGGSHDPPRPVVLVVAAALLFGCTIPIPESSRPQESPLGTDPSEPAPGTPADVEFSDLSGLWTGQETLTRLGECRLEGGSDSITNPVSMIWRVDEEGEVQVILPDWPGVYPYTFAGKAQSDLSVSIELATSAMCSGYEHPYTAHYAGSVEVKGNTLTLEMDATEVWCPGSCIFRRLYSIQKPLPPP